MLDIREKISRKVDSLSEEAKQRHYYDKFDLDSDGKPKKKPFVYPCLRDAPKITCSKRVRSDDRVGDVYAEISKLQQEGIGLQDQLKIQLALKILDVTKLEITALWRLLILEYMELCIFMAGCIVCELSKPAKGRMVPKTKDLDVLIMKILELHLFEVDGKTWANILCHDAKYPGDRARGDAAVEILKYFGIEDETSQNEKLDSKFNPADDDLIHAASADLKCTMAAITSKVFKDFETAKANAKAEGEKIKFLGVERVKQKTTK